MKKLTEVQQIVLDRAKGKIEFARTHNIIDWALNELGYTNVTEPYARKVVEKNAMEVAERYAEEYAEEYENEKKGIVLIVCNTRTLEKLEELGLIEIIELWGTVDRIRVIE